MFHLIYRDRDKLDEERENLFQRKEQDITSGARLNEMEISNLPDKEFKIMVIKMLIELGRIMDEHSENFDKEIKNTRKYKAEVTELKNTITEPKTI